MNQGEQINNVEKGRAPTLLHTELANKVINSLNALNNIKIIRSSEDKVHYSSEDVLIELKETSEEQKGLDITIFFTTAEWHDGTEVTIPHTMEFKNGVLVSYDEST